MDIGHDDDTEGIEEFRVRLGAEDSEDLEGLRVQVRIR